MTLLHITDRYMLESTPLLSLWILLKEENNIIRRIKKKHADFREHARTRQVHRTGVTLLRVLCNVTAVTVPRLRRSSSAWLRPLCVLKVCHWVKVARAAEWRGVAGNGSHGRTHDWEHLVLSTNCGHTTRRSSPIQNALVRRHVPICPSETLISASVPSFADLQPPV